MNKNTNLRNKIKQIIDNNRIEVPKKKPVKSYKAKNLNIQNTKVYDIKLLLQEDSKRLLEKLSQNPFTRDISHIQDKIQQPKISLPILPTDLQTLKKLSESFNSPKYKSKDSTENILQFNKKTKENELPETFERHMLGHPTGRQDIKELCTWFNSMLETYRDADLETIELIYETCTKEIIRQVSVHCIERGELLQLLFTYQPEIYKKKQEIIFQDVANAKVDHEKKIQDLKLKYKKIIDQTEEKLKLALNLSTAYKNEAEKLSKELYVDKKKYADLIKKYSEDERAWKQKNLMLLQRLKRNYTVTPKQIHPLSVLNLKKEFLDSEPDVGDNRMITEEVFVSEFEESPENNPGKFFRDLYPGYEMVDSETEYDKADFESDNLAGNQEKDRDSPINPLEIQAKYPYEDIENQIKLIENLEKEIKAQEKVLERNGKLIENKKKINQMDTIKNQIKIIEDQSKSIKNSELNENTEKLSPNLDILEMITEKSSVYNLNPQIPIKNKPINLNSSKQNFGATGNPLKTLELSNTSSISINSYIRPHVLKYDSENDLVEDHSSSDRKANEQNLLDISARSKSQSNIPKFFATVESQKTQNKKKPQRFIFTSTKPPKDPQESQKLHQKDLEWQQKVNLLNQQLKEKENIIAEYSKNLNSSNSNLMNRLKLEKANNFVLKLPRGLSSSKDPTPRPSSRALYPGNNTDEKEFIDDTLMPNGCDSYSWKTGYFSGYEKGRKDGIREGEILGIEERDFDGQKESNSLEEEYSDPEVKRKSVENLLIPDILKRISTFKYNSSKKLSKDVTKIINFQFYKQTIQPKKQHPVNSVLLHFLSKSTESILSKCTLSRKIVNKIIHGTYTNCLVKLKNGDEIDSLTEQIYDDFYQKYGLKSVSDKRFTEFISSLMNYSDYRRVLVFLKFLGCSRKLNYADYTKLTFLYYLNALQFMLNAKIGIVIAFEDIADKQMFPTQRAIECVKERIEWFVDKNTLDSVISAIQAQSEVDNKGINLAGLVELELVLEMIIEHYEEYQKNVKNGLINVLNAICCEESLLSYEFLMIVRHISFDRLEFIEEEQKIDYNKKINFFQLLKELETKESLTIEEVTNKCTENNLLKFTDLKKFLEPSLDLNHQKVLAEIKLDRDYYENIASEIGSYGKRYKSLDGDQFLAKMHLIADTCEEKDPWVSLLGWKIFQAELQRVKSDYLNFISSSNH
jgi:hypothetical protein